MNQETNDRTLLHILLDPNDPNPEATISTLREKFRQELLMEQEEDVRIKKEKQHQAEMSNLTVSGLERQQEREFAYSNSFHKQIERMNNMYKLPVNFLPTLPKDVITQLTNFKNILAEEVNEIDDIIAMSESNTATDLEIVTAIADILGDVVVYCRSEAMKFGIPLEDVLTIIMESNFSKLGENGKPIYDERNKVQKGPNYFKPEPAIAKRLNAGPGVQQGKW